MSTVSAGHKREPDTLIPEIPDEPNFIARGYAPLPSFGPKIGAGTHLQASHATWPEVGGRSVDTSFPYASQVWCERQVPRAKYRVRLTPFGRKFNEQGIREMRRGDRPPADNGVIANEGYSSKQGVNAPAFAGDVFVIVVPAPAPVGEMLAPNELLACHPAQFTRLAKHAKPDPGLIWRSDCADDEVLSFLGPHDRKPASDAFEGSRPRIIIGIFVVATLDTIQPKITFGMGVINVCVE